MLNNLVQVRERLVGEVLIDHLVPFFDVVREETMVIVLFVNVEDLSIHCYDSVCVRSAGRSGA